MNSEDKLRSFLQDRFDNEEVPLRDRHWLETKAFLEKRRRRNKLRVGAIFSVAVVGILVSWFFLHDSNVVAEKLNHGNSGQTAAASIIKDLPEPKETITRQLSGPQTKAVPSVEKKLVFLPQTSQQKGRSLPSGSSSGHLAKEFSGRVGEVDDPEIDKEGGLESGVPPTAAISISKETEIINPLDEQDIPTLPYLTGVVIPEEKIIPAGENTMFANQNEEVLVLKDVINTELNSGAALPDSLKTNQSLTENQLGPISSLINGVPGEGVYYEGGLAWYHGWKSSAGHDASGFSPVVGINYLNGLDDRFALSFGVQYNRIPQLGVSSKTSKVTSFGFGEESNVTVITPTTLHYLVVPLRFHYFVSFRHCFGAGLNAAYLLNVDSEVTTYHESATETSQRSTTNLSGHTKGFSWYDCHGSVFYRFRLTKSFSANAELFYGLVDIKDDVFFRLNGKEKNSGFKVSLTYYAFRKN